MSFISALYTTNIRSTLAGAVFIKMTEVVVRAAFHEHVVFSEAVPKLQISVVG